MLMMSGVNRVRSFIEKYNVKAEVLEFKGTIETVETASKETGYPKEKILKTMIVIGDGKPYAIILPGDKRLDFKKISKELNVKNVRLAKPEEVMELIRLSPGEVSPLLEEVKNLQVIVDRSILDRGVVLAGGGTLHNLVKISVDELIRVLNPKVKEVSKS